MISLDNYGRVKKLNHKMFSRAGLGKILKYSLLCDLEMSSNQGLIEILTPQPHLSSDELSHVLSKTRNTDLLLY